MKTRGARGGLLIIPAVVMALGGCPGDFGLERQVFPCRAEGDCIDGWRCHPTRYVCVPAEDLDAGPSDATSADR